LGSYYGFRISKKTAAVPDVEYTVTRSTDGGVTYVEMFDDDNWTIIDTEGTIGIESKVTNGGRPVAPPGTSDHKYRIGIKQA
jgi:hypothetical protein